MKDGATIIKEESVVLNLCKFPRRLRHILMMNPTLDNYHAAARKNFSKTSGKCRGCMVCVCAGDPEGCDYLNICLHSDCGAELETIN